MSDTRLEAHLRAALHAEANALPITITTAELERRRALRRRQQNGQRLTAIAAAIAAVAVGTVVALGNGWLRTPDTAAPTVAPSVTAPSLSPTPEPPGTDGRLPQAIPATSGRTELFRLDPMFAAVEWENEPFNVRTTASVVIITLRCTGVGEMRLTVLGERNEYPCNDTHRSAVAAFDVDQDALAGPEGVVQGGISVDARMGLAMLIEVPATGEILPTPAPCPTIEPTTLLVPPSILLSPDWADGEDYAGALGLYRIVEEGYDPEQWLIPSAADVQSIPTGPAARFEVLAADGATCLDQIRAAAYRLTDDEQLAGDPVTLDAQWVGNEPRGTVALPPDVGRWIVRVETWFLLANGSTARSLTYFRVVVPEPDAPYPPVWPSKLPEFPPDPVADSVVLLDRTETVPERAPSGSGDSQGHVVIDAGEIPPRSQYRVTIACVGSFATAQWSIGDRGVPGALMRRHIECDGRPVSTDVAIGTPTETMAVIVGSVPSVTWRIRVSTFVPESTLSLPALVASPEGGDPADGAKAYLQCVDLDGAGDACAGPYTWQGVGSVQLTSEQRLTFTLGPEVTIRTLAIDAVPTAAISANPFPGSVRRLTNLEPASDTVSIDLDLPAGGWVIRVLITAEDADHTYGGWYDVPVTIKD